MQEVCRLRLATVNAVKVMQVLDRAEIRSICPATVFLLLPGGNLRVVGFSYRLVRCRYSHTGRCRTLGLNKLGGLLVAPIADHAHRSLPDDDLTGGRDTTFVVHYAAIACACRAVRSSATTKQMLSSRL
jgi:hypothetical protein